jgi:glycosyltransferase involved in cell wall biosynthesis
MRILHVSPTYYPATRYGGPIRSVHGLTAALAARGHDVWVCTTNVDGEGRLDVPLGEPVLRDGVRVLYFDVPWLARLYFSPALLSWLRAEAGGFDIVHTHSIYLWPNVAATWCARRAGVPYVVSPRGMLVGDLIRRKSRFVKTAWIQLIERRELAAAGAIHATSTLEVDEAKRLGLPLPAFACIPNGVTAPGVAAPAPRFDRLPRPYALFLGRINWKKGLDRLLEAWKTVPGLHLVIAGNDDEGYQAQLESRVQTLGLEECVSFVGPVDDRDKWALYAGASLFLLPSYSENFANVVLEAMAMGCPVIVTPEVGLASVVAETGAGAVSSGDPLQLSATIRELFGDAPRRAAMGLRGAAAARERFSWEGVAAQMEAAYAKLPRPA